MFVQPAHIDALLLVLPLALYIVRVYEQIEVVVLPGEFGQGCFIQYGQVLGGDVCVVLKGEGEAERNEGGVRRQLFVDPGGRC